MVTGYDVYVTDVFRLAGYRRNRFAACIVGGYSQCNVSSFAGHFAQFISRFTSTFLAG